MAFQAVVRKWGNSFGVVFPKELVKKNKLHVNEKVMIDIVKEADLTGIFGTLERKMPGQEFKDLAREGWK